MTEVCVHQCFFSPDWLVDFAEVLRCWCFVVSNGSFVCLFVFFYFLKKGTKFLLLLCTFSNRLVLLRQPTPKFTPTSSLTDKETSRLLAVWHFDSYPNRGFPRLPSSCCRKQRRRDYTEDGGWFGGGRERFSGAVSVKCTGHMTCLLHDALPVLASMEMPTSHPLLPSKPLEKRSIRIFQQAPPSLANTPFSSANGSTARRNNSTQCASTYTHSSEGRGKRRGRGGARRRWVWSFSVGHVEAPLTTQALLPLAPLWTCRPEPWETFSSEPDHMMQQKWPETQGLHTPDVKLISDTWMQMLGSKLESKLWQKHRKINLVKSFDRTL